MFRAALILIGVWSVGGACLWAGGRLSQSTKRPGRALGSMLNGAALTLTVAAVTAAMLLSIWYKSVVPIIPCNYFCD